MRRELRALIRAILVVQQLAGSKLSRRAVSDGSSSIAEIFDILSLLIQSRNNTQRVYLSNLENTVRTLVFRQDISDTVNKWVEQIEKFGVPSDIELFPYEYEEFEDIYTTIFFSELELLAKEALKKDEKLGKMVILYALVLLGYAAGVPSFEKRAAFLLSIQDIFKSVTAGVPITNTVIPENMLDLFEYSTAQLLYKAITAAGGVAQAIEAEDLEGGNPTRTNVLHSESTKRKRKIAQEVDKDELRNLLTTG